MRSNWNLNWKDLRSIQFLNYEVMAEKKGKVKNSNMGNLLSRQIITQIEVHPLYSALLQNKRLMEICMKENLHPEDSTWKSGQGGVPSHSHYITNSHMILSTTPLNVLSFIFEMITRVVSAKVQVCGFNHCFIPTQTLFKWKTRLY